MIEKLVANDKTVYSLQYLRGLAAVIVLFQHVAIKGDQYAGNPLPWFHLGEAGVELFFIISGYIMCHTTQNSQGRLGDVGHFLVNRFTRILPLYWLLTAFALAVFLVAPDKVNSTGGETKIWESFLLFPSEGKFLIMNGWTLTYEFFFYFVFSIGLFWKGMGRWVTAGLLVALCLLPLAWPDRSVLFRFFTDPILLNFLLGIVLFEIHRQRWVVPAWASVALIVAGVALLVLWNDNWWRLPLLGIGFPCLLVSLGVVFFEDSLRQRPNRLLKLLGDSSYSLYMFHPFTLAGGALILSKLGLHQGVWAWPFLIVLFVGSLWGGALLYNYVEKPLTRWVRTLVKA